MVPFVDVSTQERFGMRDEREPERVGNRERKVKQ